MFEVTNDMRLNTDAGKVCLSSAGILTQLKIWSCYRGWKTGWKYLVPLKFFLKDRTHFVEIGNYLRLNGHDLWGSPRVNPGTPIFQFVQLKNICDVSYHNYADGTQIYVSLTAGELHWSRAQVSSLASCHSENRFWNSSSCFSPRVQLGAWSEHGEAAFQF